MHSNKLLFLYINLLSFYTNHINSIKTGKDDRLNCSLDEKLSESKCHERLCLWESIGNGAPDCYFDVNKVGYKIIDSHELQTGLNADIEAKPDINKSLPHNIIPIEKLRFQVYYLTDRIVRFKIIDPNHKRYEVPVQNSFPLLKNLPQGEDNSNRRYELKLSKVGDNFEFSILRRDTNTSLWNTSIGGLIYSDQFIQIATYLPSKNVYGFGENPHSSFRHNLTYKTWPLFARDQMQTDGPRNAYSVHPFYTCLENDGKSHGVLLLNSNAMEYSLLPYPALNYRTTGGILDFFVFVGEDPEHVIQLYTDLIGRTYMPPKWALGYQIARYGPANTNLTYVKNVLDRNVKAKIPLDMMGLDIDYMDKYYDFSFDKTHFNGLPEFMHETQDNLGLHWELIWNPEIIANDSHYTAFQEGYKSDIFMKWPKEIPMSERHNPPDVPTDTDIIYGRMWPNGPSAYPDFFRASAQKWWTKWLNYTNSELGLPLEGMWMDINEPRSFDSASQFCKTKDCYALQCPNNKYDNPPYKIIGNPILWIDTLCMASTQGENNEYRHYDVHSIYGWTQTLPTLRAIQEITGKRKFVLARSTYPSSGQSSAHWLGDNRSIFVDMHRSIIGLLEFNLFGIPWVGANICGHFGDTTPELCMRWHQLGAFYPFARNYNSFKSIDQDPAVFSERGHPEVTGDARRVLSIRYSLIPYLYTLFYISHTRGNTVFRPLFHEFPTDAHTWDIDTQFLWGSSILFSPFLKENQTNANIYIPNDIWYDFYTFKKEKTGFIDIKTAPGIHMRGGSIIPLQKSENTTKETDKNPINLYIFPKDNQAIGQLFIDETDVIDTIEKGEYSLIRFEMFRNCTLLIKRQNNDPKYKGNSLLENIYLVNPINETLIVKIDGKLKENAIKKISSDIIEVKLEINLLQKYLTSIVFEDQNTNECKGVFNKE